MPDPAFPLIDAHQHFWDPSRNYHPWLRDEPPIPFRYGDYRPIRRKYLPPDYLKDAEGYRILKTVYVETEWDPKDPLGELRYVEELRAEYGLPTVAVAQAWLHQPDASQAIALLAAFPFVRSVRHKPPPGAMLDTAWRTGFAALAPAGLRFDLQTPWTTFADAVKLATKYDNTQIILNHTGLPADRSAAGIEGWRKAMQQLAGCPNVAVKISGIGVPGQAWTVESNREIVLRTIDLFGAERCMFASNFPVDSLCASFGTIFGGFREIVADFTPGEQGALFAGNAQRIYSMED